jgi:hypothetical protein
MNLKHRLTRLEQQAHDTISREQAYRGYTIWITLHQEALAEVGVAPAGRQELQDMEEQALAEVCHLCRFPLDTAEAERFVDLLGERWVAAMGCCLSPEEHQAFFAVMQRIWGEVEGTKGYQFWADYYARHATRTHR